MTWPRVIYHLARADFLERVRRYSFLLTLLFAFYLGYLVASGKMKLWLDEYRGVYTSAWIGTLTALTTSCFVSLVGFYVVKNAVDRDRRTRVGHILATTPLSKLAYVLGKAISNFTVLVAMVAVLALFAVAMQFLNLQDSRADFSALLSPFLLLAIPGMALIAAVAVLFETLPGLRGGFGNVLYFFVWATALGAPIITSETRFDPFGFVTAFKSLRAAAWVNIPGYRGGFGLRLNPEAPKVLQSFRWEGIHWTNELLVERMIWFGVAFAIVLVAALLFDRFDPARSKQPDFPVPRELTVSDTAEVSVVVCAPGQLAPLGQAAHRGGSRSIFWAELKLALKGKLWWWYAVAGGLLIAQLAAPSALARGELLGLAWLWPVLVWSAMGTREPRYATDQLIFSSAHSIRRQFPMMWCAGVAIAAVTGSGFALRLLVPPDWTGLIAWGTAVLFVPTLALALGVWSSTSKPFEITYTVLWYVGPLNRIPRLDFTGSTRSAHPLFTILFYQLLTVLLLVISALGRKRQLLR
jgi:hypothetical protein